MILVMKRAFLSSHTSIKEKRQLKVGHNGGGSFLRTLYTQRDRPGLLLAAPEGSGAGQIFHPISTSSHKSYDGGRLPDALWHHGVHNLAGELWDTPREDRWMRWTRVRHGAGDINCRTGIDFGRDSGHHWFFRGGWTCDAGGRIL